MSNACKLGAGKMSLGFNVVIIAAIFAYGMTILLKPTAFNNSPFKLPFAKSAQTSTGWLSITRVTGAAMVMFSYYALFELVRHAKL
jgi:hypothetical protein